MKIRTISVSEETFQILFREKSLKAAAKGEKVTYDDILKDDYGVGKKAKTEKK